MDSIDSFDENRKQKKHKSDSIVKVNNDDIAKNIYAIAVTLKNNGNIVESERLVLEAIDLFETPRFKAICFMNLGNWYMKINMVHSEKYYLKARAILPNYISAKISMGWLRMRQRNNLEAIRYTTLAIELINKADNLNEKYKTKSRINAMWNLAWIQHKEWIDGNESSKGKAADLYIETLKLVGKNTILTKCIGLLYSNNHVEFLKIYERYLSMV